MHDYMEGSEDKSRNHLICCSALTVHIRMKRMKQRDGEDGGGTPAILCFRHGVNAQHFLSH